MSHATNSTDWVLGQGRYQVKRKLGEGGMAFALLALDKTLGAEVVLKVPKPNMMADPEFTARFRREIRSMQELPHEHIVKIRDVGEHEGMPFYVMDLLAGGSLQDRFESAGDNRVKPMPPESLADWLEPVAAALDFIHQRFVHRDVKPANILFDAEGNAYVSDFGIVKAIADGSSDARQTVMTQAGMVICTPPYMAPEQMEGTNIDGRVDQYALAVTVYEALSGRVPFKGTTIIEVLRQQIIGKIPPLHELVPALPRSLTQVIQKGLSQDPKDRYATCTAFAKAVLASVQTMSAAGRSKGRPKAVCPACRKAFALPADPAGKFVACPACGTGFTVARKSLQAAPAAETNRAAVSTSEVIPVATLAPAPAAEPNRKPARTMPRADKRPSEKPAGRAQERAGQNANWMWLAILVPCVGCLVLLTALGWMLLRKPRNALAAEPETPIAKADAEKAGAKDISPFVNTAKSTEQKDPKNPVSKPPISDSTVASLQSDINAVEGLITIGKGSQAYFTFMGPTKFNLWQSTAEKGHPAAQYLYGRALELGTGCPKDPAQAVRWYRRAAENGFAAAQGNLGDCYQNGNGVAKDVTQAVKWYRTAADRGYAPSQQSLGWCYQNGLGVPRDDVEGVRWYRKAAALGFDVAQDNLGWCCQNGIGTAKDAVEGVKWHRKAAEQGWANAQNNLGVCYLNGTGVAQDEGEALKWFRKAADQDDSNAQNNLATLLEAGRAVAKDEGEAVNWYRKSANQGNVTGLFNLGRCYENGIGVPIDRAAAIDCYRRAANGGNQAARDALQRLGVSM